LYLYKPSFLDEAFETTDWTPTNSTYSTDGDIATVQTTVAGGYITRSVSYDLTTYNQLKVKGAGYSPFVTAVCTGGNVTGYPTAGSRFNTITLNLSGKGTLTAIQLGDQGASTYAYFDTVALVKSTADYDLWDEELAGNLTKEIVIKPAPYARDYVYDIGVRHFYFRYYGYIPDDTMRINLENDVTNLSRFFFEDNEDSATGVITQITTTITPGRQYYDAELVITKGRIV